MPARKTQDLYTNEYFSYKAHYIKPTAIWLVTVCYVELSARK